ncbi:precorrin-6Y C5,15-methyltransferase (decarboxylating) subunit CbiT [Anaerovibrio lipolyticus]|uniref:precorrin-6Y C5,15-methyltransferase (decarboxylating) subunit CbiT n=1 Tax=Anaerovibrio lipolyticus TaxID=82374 RepID=UPI0025F733A8|nr:precorrin-6Y C5,15-methyltransferase (decarboxylating) subunit CbiT [Anaerovibrio lipolyticus]
MPLGIPDEEFIRGKVPMTKQEIRILTIAKARIKPDSVICDVGAGTGSISIEAACQAKDGMVYAIERNPDGVELINKNAQKFGVYNLKVIEAYAPEGFDELPMLDAAIIGGSGSNLPSILDSIDKKLNTGGRIVMNCITIQTIAQCLEYMRKREDYTYEAVQVQVSQLEQVGRYDMAKANNPIYIVTCEKKRGAK